MQQLGLKEYEAKCYVALARMPSGTAKAVSQTSDVPRTRVYEAVKVLESKGLVEVQHSSPQEFRAVPIAEAAETLREEYVTRTSELVDAVEAIEPAATESAPEDAHEVWTLAGESAIGTRTREFVESAEREVLLVAGSEAACSDALVDALCGAADDGVDLRLGAGSPALAELLAADVPGAEVFVSDLGWLSCSSVDPDDDTTISRLLLVDGSTILASTRCGSAAGAATEERAVVGSGFDNGIVALARRLLADGFAVDAASDAGE